MACFYGLMEGFRGRWRLVFLFANVFSLSLSLSSSTSKSKKKLHTSSNCPLRTAAAINWRRSATLSLSGTAKEGTEEGGGDGIIFLFAF